MKRFLAIVLGMFAPAAALAGAAAAQPNAAALDRSNAVETTAFRAERTIRPNDSL